MQMIEQYAYQVGPVTVTHSFGRLEKERMIEGRRNPFPGPISAWDAAKADYDASPVRGKAFCTLNRQEQVDIVRKYVNR
jgi:hypothetical protein